MLSRLVPLAFVIIASSVRAEPLRLHDTDLVRDKSAVAARAWTTAVVTTWAAIDPSTREALPDAVVSAWVVALGAKTDVIPRDAVVVKTGADGNAIVRVRAPASEGSYQLVIDTRSRWGGDRLVRPLIVVSRRLLVLRTDRSWYQPGQTIRWRTTLLEATDAHPVAGAEVTLELRDRKGTLLWREVARGDAHGMASGTLPMSPTTVGHVTLMATAGSESVSNKLELKRTELPRIVVSIVGIQTIDGRVSGFVNARYPYGEPVHGKVTVTLDKQPTTAQLDKNGRYAFDVPLGAGRKHALEATVEDEGSQRGQAREELEIPESRFMFALVSGGRGADGRTALTVITTDGNGGFVPAHVTITARRGSVASTLELSRGVIRIEAQSDDAGEVDLTILAEGNGKSASETFAGGPTEDRTSIEVDDVLVDAGSSIAVRGRWKEAGGPVTVSLLRGGAPIAATTASVSDGILRATLVPPVGVFGLCVVRAAAAIWDGRMTSRVVIAERLVYLAPATLELAITGAGRYAPGQTPRVAVSVKDAAGRPVPNVGLAASVVDERALLLSKKPVDVGDAMRAFAVDSRRRIPCLMQSGEQLGLAFARLLGSGTLEGRLAARAIIEEMDEPVRQTPEAVIAGAQRFRHEYRRIQEVMDLVVERLDGPSEAFIESADHQWLPRAEVAALLAEAASRDAERLVSPSAAVAELTPWAQPMSWDYVLKIDERWNQARVGATLAERRLEALQAALVATHKAQRRKLMLAPKRASVLADLVARGELAAHLTNDPWGRRIEVEVEVPRDRGRPVRIVVLRSVGPDGVSGSDDDMTLRDVFVDSRDHGGWGGAFTADGSGGGGEGGGRIRSVIGDIQRLEVVRQRFDETVLWVTGVTTGPGGDATFGVPLADSITGWELQVDAVSTDGAVGTTRAHLETFLPLHITAEPPARLVVGDSTVMRVVVANQSGRARRLNLIARGSGGLGVDSAKGSPELLDLADGDIASVDLTLAATEVGSGKLRLALVEGDAEVDAIEREVPIEPLGARIQMTRATRAKDGLVSFAIEVPQTIAAGSAKARIALYRGLADLSRKGLADMIKEPHGCFEQTSSTTHPNVLLLELLGSEPDAQQARDSARSFIAMGYQRLVSYEVEGEPGGFSLFGRAPASRSLTAYGLLEFSDIARVFPVDLALLARIRAYLGRQQKTDGSWDPDGSGDRFALTAFVAWALAEAGSTEPAMQRVFDQALDYLTRNRGSISDPYTIALWANAEALAKRPPNAGPKLAAFANSGPTGLSYVARAERESLMYARGLGATLQLTALASMWHARSGAIAEARSALGWLWDARGQSGDWGSTHSTMLALRAAKVVFDPKAAELPDGIAVMVDGQPIGTLRDGEGAPGLDVALTPGAHVVSVALPAALDGLHAGLDVEWRSLTAPDARADGLVVSNVRDGPPVRGGGRIGMTVTITNEQATAVSMPTLVIPIPTGLQVSSRALVGADMAARVASVDDLGSELHVYLTTIAAGETLRFEYTLETSVPCDLTQRPVEAFAYYDPTTRGTSAQGRIEVMPASQAPANGL